MSNCLYILHKILKKISKSLENLRVWAKTPEKVRFFLEKLLTRSRVFSIMLHDALWDDAEGYSLWVSKEITFADNSAK